MVELKSSNLLSRLRALGKRRDLAIGEYWNAVDEAADEIERLRTVLGMDQPWPLPDVLAKLIQATEHLLNQHDCDAHGHEEYRAAADYGQAMLLVLRAAPEPRDG